jgi:hypothetical protein
MLLAIMDGWTIIPRKVKLQFKDTHKELVKLDQSLFSKLTLKLISQL